MGSKTKPPDVEIATKPQFFSEMSSVCDKVVMQLEGCEVTGGFIVFGIISESQFLISCSKSSFPTLP